MTTGKELGMTTTGARVWSYFAFMFSVVGMLYFVAIYRDFLTIDLSEAGRAVTIMGLTGLFAVLHGLVQWSAITHRSPRREGQTLLDIFVAILFALVLMGLVGWRMVETGSWQFWTVLSTYELWVFILFFPVAIMDIYIGTKTALRFARFGSPTEIGQP